MSDKKPKIESTKLAHKGFFDLRIDHIKRPNQPPQEYTTLLTKTEAVIVLAQTPEEKWILLHEYRHSIGKYILGTPGGRVEKGEDFAECAKRELLEETGYLAESVHPIGKSHPLPSICDQKLEFYFAKNAQKQKEPNLDPYEFIEVILLSDEELKKHIIEESLVDGALITAYAYKKLFSF